MNARFVGPMPNLSLEKFPSVQANFETRPRFTKKLFEAITHGMKREPDMYKPLVCVFLFT
jgi:hypothetical protein